MDSITWDKIFLQKLHDFGVPLEDIKVIYEKEYDNFDKTKPPILSACNYHATVINGLSMY